MNKCTFDPSVLVNVALGIFHCPTCGEMVVAGMLHPDYSLPESGKEADVKARGETYEDYLNGPLDPRD